MSIRTPAVRQPILCEDHAEIPLTRGKTAVIDLCDVKLVAGLNWQAQCTPNDRWYASAKRRGGRSMGRILLHRLILNAPRGIEVDHVDGDGLNNLRSNLRLATRSQNQSNKNGIEGTSSRYKGVHLSNGKYWVARCAHNYIGCFQSEEDAARAYDVVALEKYGEFARLNFPPTQDITTNEAAG